MFSTTRRKEILFYLAAVVAPVLTLLARVAVEHLYAGDPSLQRFGELPRFLFFIPVVVLVALFVDAWAGFLATMVSSVLIAYWVLPPEGQLKVGQSADVLGLSLFLIVGVTVCAIAELYHRNIRRLESYRNALQESEARFRSFMDNSPAIAWMKDAQGRYVYLSKTYENLTGARSEDWHGKTDADVRPQQHIARTFREHDLVVLTTNQPLQAIVDSHKEDGTAITLLVAKFPFETANGERFVGGVGVDITERMRMEDALRESETRFRLFMDNSPAPAWMKDEQGRYVYLSKAFERSHFELRLGDCLNKTDAEIFPPQLATQFRDHDLNTLAANCPLQVVEDAPDGSTWLVTRFPFPTASGERFIAGVSIDITDRTRAEEALRESEERLRLLGDNLPNSVVFQYTYEPSGRRPPRLLYISAGTERLNGVKAEDAFRDFSLLERLILPNEAHAFKEAEEKSARELSTFEHETQIRLPNGQIRWMHFLSHPRRLSDGRVVWDGVQTDITERKRAQEELLRSEKLAATGRLAATIAHEVNNPLAAAMNAVYIANTVPAQAGEMLKLAERELRRAAHITQQTLGFYREHGNEQSSVTKLVEELLVVYSAKLRNRHVTVRRRYRCDIAPRRGECPDGCEGCLLVHAGELRQIISNLLANGIDALSDGGVMHIRISRLPDRIKLTIADDGHGIRTEHLKRVFEPFFTTKKDFGTGLGLWVTQELVRKHNGVIKVRSSKGKGTVFRLTFPHKKSGDGGLLTASPASPARAA